MDTSGAREEGTDGASIYPQSSSRYWSSCMWWALVASSSNPTDSPETAPSSLRKSHSNSGWSQPSLCQTHLPQETKVITHSGQTCTTCWQPLFNQLYLTLMKTWKWIYHRAISSEKKKFHHLGKPMKPQEIPGHHGLVAYTLNCRRDSEGEKKATTLCRPPACLL